MDENDLELLRARLSQKVKAKQLAGDDSEAGGLGRALAMGGLDVLQTANNSSLYPVETLTGLKLNKPQDQADNMDTYRRAEAERMNRRRQAALDDMNSLSAVQKIIEARKERERAISQRQEDLARAEKQRKQDFAMKGYSLDADGNPTMVKGGIADLERRAKEASIAKLLADANRANALAKKGLGAGGVNRDLFVPGVGEALTKDDAKKLKDASAIKDSFMQKADELYKLRQDYGTEFFNRSAVNRMKQLSKELLLDYKNMQSLGVLSKSDEDIINSVIPSDPSEMTLSTFGFGNDPVLSQIAAFKNDTLNDYQNKVKARTGGGVALSGPVSVDDEDVQALEWLQSNIDSPDAPAVASRLKSKGLL